MALVAASQALAQAGLPEPRVNSEEVAVVVGSSIGGFAASDAFFRDYYLHGATSPLVIPISMNNGPASNISIRYGLQGPLLALDAACASAAHAIGYCYNLIRTGQLEVAVTGGADSPFSTGVVEAWCAMRALSERNTEPATACRPFSADRDGLRVGELGSSPWPTNPGRDRRLWGHWRQLSPHAALAGWAGARHAPRADRCRAGARAG